MDENKERIAQHILNGDYETRCPLCGRIMFIRKDTTNYDLLMMLKEILELRGYILKCQEQINAFIDDINANKREVRG